jgi:hypothetical protein
MIPTIENTSFLIATAADSRAQTILSTRWCRPNLPLGFPDLLSMVFFYREEDATDRSSVSSSTTSTSRSKYIGQPHTSEYIETIF